MSNHLLPQNDFFIYVPSLQATGLPSRNDAVDERLADNIDQEHIPAKLNTWLKIALSGIMHVYVSPDQVDEELACSN
jgi:hypothetical protein